jgi:hypothetical protein
MKTWISGGEGLGVMEPESENHDLVHVEASSRPKNETDADIAPLIRKVEAASISEIEKLIGGGPSMTDCRPPGGAPSGSWVLLGAGEVAAPDVADDDDATWAVIELLK